MAYLWDWFVEISLGIEGNGQTYPGIAWESIRAWSEVTGQDIAPRDAKVIVMLGNQRAAIMQEALKAKLDAHKR